MGAFFTNCNVRTKDKAKCAQLLASSINSRALMTDPKNGWITVYDEGCESQDINILRHLAKRLSAKLKTVAIAILVHDSDVFQYLIYERGELVDQFNSSPDCFGPVSDAQEKEWRGNFSKLLPYAVKGATLSDFKHAAKKEYALEEERVSEFSKLLGIDPSRAMTGFKYVQEGKHSFKVVYAKGYSKDQALLVKEVSRGDLGEVQALLQKGTSPDQKDEFGAPLLVVASRRGKSEMVRELIAHGADIFAQVPGGGDALWSASAEGHDEIVEHLLEKGKGSAKFDSSLQVAFGAAVMAGHAKVIKRLIRAGVDANANTSFGQPPLILASMRGLEFIWEEKMKRPFTGGPGQGKTDWKEVVMTLLEAGAQIPFPTKDGPIDVKTLSADQRSKLADKLLEACAKIKLPERYGGKPSKD